MAKKLFCVTPRAEALKLAAGEFKEYLKNLDHAYFNTDTPLVSDEEYDALVKAYEKKYGPRKEVGVKPDQASRKIALPIPMGSLAKVYTQDEFDRAVKNITKGGSRLAIVAQKIDGVAVLLEFVGHEDEDGTFKFARAFTRGDGNIGSDITQHIQNVFKTNAPEASEYLLIPQQCKKPFKATHLYIKAELTCSLESFTYLNSTLAKKLVHPRNLVSGYVNHLSPSRTTAKYLTLFLHSVHDETDSSLGLLHVDTYSGKNVIFDGLYSIKLPDTPGCFLLRFYKKGRKSFVRTNAVHSSYAGTTSPITITVSDKEQLTPTKFFRAFKAKYINDSGLREALPPSALAVQEYGNNVFAVDSEAHYVRDGYVVCFVHHGQQAFAVKNSAPAVKKTTVTNIEWGVSKSGRLKPTVVFKPVTIDGITISRATGHNYEWVTQKRVGIGAIVEIVRAGEVIPYIQKVVKSVSVQYNTGRPSLPYSVEGKEAVINVYGLGYKDPICVSILVKNLEYFCTTLGVLGFTKENFELLLQHYLSWDQEFPPTPWKRLRNLMPTGCASDEATSILLLPYQGFNPRSNRDTNATLQFAEFIYLKFEEAYSHFNKKINAALVKKAIAALLEAVSKASTFELMGAYQALGPGFAAKRIEKVVHKPEHKDALYHFHQCLTGLTNALGGAIVAKPINLEDSEPRSKVNGKTIVFSGVRDAPLELLFIKGGFSISETVSSKTAFLVVKNDNFTSSKVTKAKGLGIPVVTICDVLEYYEAICSAQRRT